jgi:plastocyanin
MRKSLTITLTLVAMFAATLSLAPSADAVTYEVEIEDFAFTPGSMHINPGDAIEWRNRDAVQHTSTSDEGLWNSGLLAEDQTFTFIFNDEGVYPYHCSPHPFMVDTIFVEAQTDIDDQLPTLPDKVELSQNYPNPFNAQTAIAYSLPFESHVRITIFNILGQTIETLVDQNQPAGYHQALWDATDDPTGVYFYRIEAADFVATRKMLLAK